MSSLVERAMAGRASSSPADVPLDSEQAVIRGVPMTVGVAAMRCAMAVIHQRACDTAQLDALMHACDQLAVLGQRATAMRRVPRLNDTMGQSRRLYWPLAVVLHARLLHDPAIAQALGPLRTEQARKSLLQAATAMPLADEHIPAQTADTLWAIAARRCLAGTQTCDRCDPLLDTLLAAGNAENALHPFVEEEQQLDSWWYHELAGLHALVDLAVDLDQPSLHERVANVAIHHMANIHPDHVTTQPWGLAAFVLHPQTHCFADQQLHDTTTALHAVGGNGIVHAMLLLDGLLSLHRDHAQA